MAEAEAEVLCSGWEAAAELDEEELPHAVRPTVIAAASKPATMVLILRFIIIPLLFDHLKYTFSLYPSAG